MTFDRRPTHRPEPFGFGVAVRVENGHPEHTPFERMPRDFGINDSNWWHIAHQP